MQDPEYSFDEFKRCCINNPTRVFPHDHALKGAKEFGLKTKSELLNFIGNDGLGQLQFIHKKLWEKNPNKSLAIYVDSYEFRSLYMRGYIAFMRNPNTKLWVIKSFKPSTNNNFALADGIRKIRSIKEG